MLKMRFKRCGRKRQPMYRIVVMPATNPRDGKAIRELGFLRVRNIRILAKQEKMLLVKPKEII